MTVEQKVRTLNDAVQEFEFDSKNIGNLTKFEFPSRIKALRDYIFEKSNSNAQLLKNMRETCIKFLNENLSRLSALEISDDKTRTKEMIYAKETSEKAKNLFLFHAGELEKSILSKDEV